ncbi:MAG: bifunctional riboflavin kinase/FAD synthetase [Chloroflexota bacterium]|nr:bifunctional riboflavin kinase/FAD synthetase [Chloroflexota bacterium]
MKITNDITQRQPAQAVLTIGSFDGVHLGHQALIRSVVGSARDKGIAAVALTFEPSPREVLSPGQPLAYLTPLPQKLDLLAQTGLDETVVIPFTKDLSQVQAPDFIHYLRRYLLFTELWEGENFALGRGRTGNIEVLTDLGRHVGYNTLIAPLVEMDGQPISSSRIRLSVMQGRVSDAARLLGHYHAISGTVVPGSRRGRELGYPTANLATPPHIALPVDGIYATFVTRPATGEILPSVTSIGTRPTFEDDARLVEAFIIDYSADLYGEALTVHFVQHLRPQVAYTGVEPLIAQMDKDTVQAREIVRTSVAPGTSPSYISSTLHTVSDFRSKLD